MRTVRALLPLMVGVGLIALAGPAGAQLAAPVGMGNQCKPEGLPQSKCNKDAQCCAGLLCQSGQCRGGCRIGGTFYTSGTHNPANQCQSCQPAVNTSNWTNLASGTACNDGNRCTYNDVCNGSGTCGGTAITCTSDQCNARSCNGTSTCTVTPKTGSACDDGYACTYGDTCTSAGGCVGTGITCASDQCNTRSCNGTSTCAVTPLTGIACDDGNACTQTDTCQAGVCTGSNTVVCTALDQCHVAGTCDPTTGMCSNPAAPDQTPCNDNNLCTGGDRCLSGVCTGASLTVCIAGSDQCHDPGTCVPSTGLCSNPPKANGTTCDDGNKCTGADACQSGTCVGSPVICPPNPFPAQCQTGGSTCDTVTGQCVPVPLTNGTACDDGNSCTTGDSCQNGTCVGTTAGNGTACDDGNACTTGETCTNGVCGNPTNVVICPPGIPSQCLTGNLQCNPTTGQCVDVPVTNGTACDDSSACTTGDTCQAGTCTGTSCGPRQACCSTSNPCVDLDFDSANCGSCGTACTNSVCLFGQCFDGCIIDGVGYTNGALNPANDCQACDTSMSRTTWTSLGSSQTQNPPTCHDGCFTGFCVAGGCGAFNATPIGGTCATTTICEVATCDSTGNCVHTPNTANNGVSCTPLSAIDNSCAVSTTGTCQDGSCVVPTETDGTSCAATPQGPDAACLSTNGKCKSGSCVPDVLTAAEGEPCNLPGSPVCEVGVCNDLGVCAAKTNTCPMPAGCGTGSSCNISTGQCDYPPVSEFPDGTIDCGTVFTGGKDPSQCCPGQVCSCPPGEGSTTLCFEFHCFDPADFPS